LFEGGIGGFRQTLPVPLRQPHEPRVEHVVGGCGKKCVGNNDYIVNLVASKEALQAEPVAVGGVHVAGVKDVQGVVVVAEPGNQAIGV